MLIREAHEKDTARIVQLLNSAEELRAGDEPYYECYIAESIRNATNLILVGEGDADLQGVLVGEVWKEQEYAYIANIVIDEDYKRQGLGSALYAYFETHCRSKGIRTINFFVKQSNENMQRWSEKQGFKKGELFYYFEKGL